MSIKNEISNISVTVAVKNLSSVVINNGKAISYSDPTKLIDELMTIFSQEIDVQYLCVKHATNHLHKAGAKLVFPDGSEVFF